MSTPIVTQPEPDLLAAILKLANLMHLAINGSAPYPTDPVQVKP